MSDISAGDSPAMLDAKLFEENQLDEPLPGAPLPKRDSRRCRLRLSHGLLTQATDAWTGLARRACEGYLVGKEG